MGEIWEFCWSRELAEREGTNLISRSKSNPSSQNQISMGLSATISQSMVRTRPSSSSSAHKVSADKQVENIFEALISKIPYYEEFRLPLIRREYYVPVERNIYLTERCIEDDGLFCSCTPSTGSSRACDKACQSGMSFSCCSSKCKCDDTCANKSFQHRPQKKTKLVKTAKCGMGLVAQAAIKKGEFIMEYVGEVIDGRTCEQRLWNMKRMSKTDFYLCEVSSNMVIDAADKGNMSRFINHSCEPNTEMQKWTVDGETRVGIFALCRIKKGEELTYDYKNIAPQKYCHCGSSSCRKILGPTNSIASYVFRGDILDISGSSKETKQNSKRKCLLTKQRKTVSKRRKSAVVQLSSSALRIQPPPQTASATETRSTSGQGLPMLAPIQVGQPIGDSSQTIPGENPLNTNSPGHLSDQDQTIPVTDASVGTSANGQTAHGSPPLQLGKPTPGQNPTSPTLSMEGRMKQAHESPDNSLFPYSIGDALGEGEEISSADILLSAPSDEVKAILRAILPLLDQDIGLLIQDAEGIRSLYQHIKGNLRADVEDALIQVAFIENRQFQVLQAQKRLADRAQQIDTILQRDQSKNRANNLKHQINILSNSRPTIVEEIDRLKAKRAELMKEVERLTKAIDAEEDKLANLPDTLAKMTEELNSHIRTTVKIHKSIKPIPGSADDDQRVVNEADQIRLRAIDAIRGLLEPM